MAGNGQVRSADGLVAPAVTQTLAALDLEDEDAAAARLAERYAALIDRASFAAGAAERLLRAVSEEDVELRDQIDALRKLVSEQNTLDRLGKRLEDTLDALGGTPKARVRNGTAKPPAPTGPSRLDVLRGGKAG